MRKRQRWREQEDRDRDRQTGREDRKRGERESKCLGNVCQDKRILRKANTTEKVERTNRRLIIHSPFCTAKGSSAKTKYFLAFVTCTVVLFGIKAGTESSMSPQT